MCHADLRHEPTFLDKSDVDQATLDKEKEILMVQAKEDPKNASKPENIIEKMVMGRIGKYYEENCLLQQASSRRTRPPWRSTWPKVASSWVARSP